MAVGVELTPRLTAQGACEMGEPLTMTLELTARAACDRAALPAEETLRALEPLTCSPADHQGRLELRPPEVGHDAARAPARTRWG